VACTDAGCPEYIWVNTGVWIEDGDTLYLDAGGGIGFANGAPPTAGPDGQVGFPAQPHGAYYYVASELDRYSLIRRIGGSDVTPTTRHRLGDPFGVGAELLMQASRTGYL